MTCVVHSRSNDGADLRVDATTRNEAEVLAKKARVTSGHMVCIEENGERIKRWDRNRVSGENRWCAVEVNAFETLGKIREICRG